MVILRQTAKNNVIPSLIRKAKENGVKVLFDLDDLVFDYQDVGLVSNTVKEKNILYWIGYFWGIRRIAKKVDGFLCTNDYLGKKLKRSFGKNYSVIPNSLNEEQIKMSNECIKHKKHDGFRIGYFSGSPTHAKDFRLIEPEIIQFLNKHKDAKLNIVGYMDCSDEVNQLKKEGKVETMSMVNYLELQKMISDVDVNIAPLVINDFTNCKSELKFFEAAIVETTTIASPTEVFKRAIKDGENGYLAQPNEWCKKISFLYEHNDENKKTAKRARKYVLDNYYGKNFLSAIENAYDCFCDDSGV